MTLKDVLNVIPKSQSIDLKIAYLKDVDLASEEITFDIKTESYDSKDDVPKKYFDVGISAMQIKDNVIILFLDVDILAEICGREFIVRMTRK